MKIIVCLDFQFKNRGESFPAHNYNDGMRLLILIVLALGSLAIASGPASAHRPYFSQIEKIRLHNGELGEVRLLHGDGILGPDPVRAILIDAQGELLARSHKSRSMALECREKGECLIFDFSAGKVLELVPSSFRQGSPVPGLTDEERNELWELEDGSESWGFVERDLSLREKILGYEVLVLSRLPLISFNIVIGFLCALLMVPITTITKEIERRHFDVFLAVFAILLIVGVGFFLILVSGFFSLMGELTFGLWLISLGLGGIFAFAAVLVRKRSRTRTASPIDRT